VTRSSDTGPARNTSALFARASRNSDRVIVPINDSALNIDGSTPAFYCVHSISGSVGDFYDFARRLDPAVRFYGIQAPPLQIQDVKFGSSIESIADCYVNALIKFQPQGPIVLGGYCVGAVIALEMAKILRARGREVGPLLVIDGAPENTGGTLSRWNPCYWLELARNLPDWGAHGDLIRNGSFESWVRSILHNFLAIVRTIIGLKRGEKLGGGYAIEGPYSPAHRLFIDRLFRALFLYVPENYSQDVVLYEAKIAPVLYLPQHGTRWREFAPHTEIVRIVGTHLGMMLEPYVDEVAGNMRQRIVDFFSINT
jgi:thioesterase domain-containing protein